MYRVARLARMEYQTTELYSPWENKSESMSKIIKGKAKRRRVHRSIHNRVWDLDMVWEAEIYSRTAGKDGRPYLEQLTGERYISLNVCNLSSIAFCGSGITRQIISS